jgi:hypothetical protein
MLSDGNAPQLGRRVRLFRFPKADMGGTDAEGAGASFEPVKRFRLVSGGSLAPAAGIPCLPLQPLCFLVLFLRPASAASVVANYFPVARRYSFGTSIWSFIGSF